MRERGRSDDAERDDQPGKDGAAFHAVTLTTLRAGEKLLDSAALVATVRSAIQRTQSKIGLRAQSPLRSNQQREDSLFLIAALCAAELHEV